jgi:hypothetical protein
LSLLFDENTRLDILIYLKDFIVTNRKVFEMKLEEYQSLKAIQLATFFSRE